jgi:hypothetical protein
VRSRTTGRAGSHTLVPITYTAAGKNGTSVGGMELAYLGKGNRPIFQSFTKERLMIRSRYWLIPVLAALMLGVALADPKEPDNQVAGFMRLKLVHSQKVLEGLVMEDFSMIDKEAQALSLLSQDANWQVLQTPEYLQMSVEFRRTTDALSRAAREKNLNKATLAYLGMTMKCVSCHEHVRDVRMARAD